MIGHFNPSFPNLEKSVGGGSTGARSSVHVGNPLSHFPLLMFRLFRYNHRYIEYKENVFCSVKGLEICFYVLESLCHMTALLHLQGAIN